MPSSITPVTGSIPDSVRPTAPSLLRVEAEERELFQRELSSFVPPNAFDAHAHLYDFAHVAEAMQLPPETMQQLFPEEPQRTEAGFEVFLEQQRRWMGDLAPVGGLFFAFPSPASIDVTAGNRFVHEQVKSRPQSRGLLLIKPTDDPAAVEAQVQNESWAGFKVYHVFADRTDTQNAEIGEFVPEWAWEIAHRHELAIMLHMVRARSLADPGNQEYINAMCRKYSGARLILAHAGRGFCGRHTVEGISAVAGLGNLFFDTSAVCEAAPFEAILKTFGATRLMYGSDFPISESRGRAISVGDSFHWMYDWQHENWPIGKPTLIGIESLLALQQACRTLALNDSDIEQIFGDNARAVLKIDTNTRVDEQALYREAKAFIPGGTQLLSKRPEMYAPDMWPPYYREARGCEIITLEGKRVLDFTTNGIGSCLLGFAHPVVTDAVVRRTRLGAMSTLNPPEEVELARKLIDLHPWAQAVRFGRMGGETMSMAVRIARAATGRDKIAFCGYHGWHDWYLSANLAAEGALVGHLLPGLQPTGVPRGLHGSTLPFNYNDLASLQKVVSENKGDLAAVVMEPTRNFEPEPGFLEGVRELCKETGTLLIFDEVSSGFRVHRTGAHLKYGVEPDLVVYAKALGNGHPMAAILGKQDTMQVAQDSFISSTYWTESVGPVAALATLEVLGATDAPAHVAKIAQQMRDRLADLAAKLELPLKIGGLPALTKMSFEHSEAEALLTLFTVRMLDHGFLAGGGFYPTLAHKPEHVAEYLSAAAIVFEELKDAIEKNDVSQRLQTPVKHGGFARLN